MSTSMGWTLGAGRWLSVLGRAPDPEPFICGLTEETEAQFPGGSRAWLAYIKRTIRYPKLARDLELEGEVRLRFVIEPNGRVGEKVVECGPGMGQVREGGKMMGVLEREAMRVVQASGRWKPAVMGRKKVRSYKVQPFIFKLE